MLSLTLARVAMHYRRYRHAGLQLKSPAIANKLAYHHCMGGRTCLQPGYRTAVSMFVTQYQALAVLDITLAGLTYN